MNNIAAVERVLDRVLMQDVESVLDLVDERVELMVLSPQRGHAPPEIVRGRRAVTEYFERQGGIAAFWNLWLEADEDRVLVFGRESYTTTCELEAESDFALVFELRKGVIVRILAVEDLPPSLRPTTFSRRPLHRCDGLLQRTA
jgi:ketosteroid isomerase-like protein